MAYSLNALASQVLHDTSSGMSIRTELNREMVYDILMQMMAAILRDRKQAGLQVDIVPFCTVIPGRGLPIQKADFTQGGLLVGEHIEEPEPEEDPRAFGLPIEQCRCYVRLPRILNLGGSKGPGTLAINYIGSIDGGQKLDVYTGEDYKYAAHTAYTGQNPFIWIQNNVGWLFSPRPLPWQQLVLRAVLADFREMAEFGRVFDFNETPCPWDDDFSDDLVKNFANRYISMYGRALKQQAADGNLSNK